MPGDNQGIENIREIGDLGLIVFDGTGYFFVTEHEWKQLTRKNGSPAHAGTVLSVEKGGESVFVNLDLIGKAPVDRT